MTAEPPRLVAIDLDGTLLRSDGTISPRTVAALDLVGRSGSRFVFITGRPPRYVTELFATFGYKGLAVCANGALTWDAGRQVVLAEKLIPPATLAAAAARWRRAIPGIGLAVEYPDGQLRDAIYRPGPWGGPPDEMLCVPDAELFARDAMKLLGRHPTLTADELLTLGAPATSDIVATYHSGGVRLLEATALGVDKGTAIAAVAADLDIPASAVAAFGDQVNDLPMLAWAGRSYAVANAHPAVLAQASQIAPANDEDGVAVTLEHLFAGQE